VDDETRYLEKMAEPLRERGLHVDTQVALGDCEGAWATASVAGSSGRVSAAEEILKAAQELGADVIVMATHGHGALAKAAFGSVTERVLRAGICPVLLVRPGKLN
jgi:nucleotide-binding universal stress UspA family protein